MTARSYPLPGTSTGGDHAATAAAALLATVLAAPILAFSPEALTLHYPAWAVAVLSCADVAVRTVGHRWYFETFERTAREFDKVE